jgi:hypothetical protein
MEVPNGAILAVVPLGTVRVPPSAPSPPSQVSTPLLSAFLVKPGIVSVLFPVPTVALETRVTDETAR